MASAFSPLPSPPPPTVQPDHFYGSEGTQFPLSPNSNGRTWLEPDDDPLASRGIPVFKPSMEEFEDFEGYMNKIECWGIRSGIVKVIPPKEWTDALPSLAPQLAKVKLKNPIEQHMLGCGGLFRQQNVEKRRVFSVREWAELCSKEDRRAPSVEDIGLQHARRAAPPPPPRTRAKKGERAKADGTKAAAAGPVSIPVIDNAASSGDTPTSPKSLPNDGGSEAANSPANLSAYDPQSEHPIDVHSLPTPERLREEEEDSDDNEARDEKPTTAKPKRKWQTREKREAHLAERAAADAVFLESFDPRTAWLPPNTRSEDYTPEFCKDLERRYWRNCGFGAPAMYGADMEGSLFTNQTTAWNVAHLPSLLNRLIPSSSNGLPGVNTPYLYFGMWRATFAWHVEDMDLFSINYIHFGAGKFWYAVPQARASALEQTMRGHFPEPSRCPQFLRHKSYLASPMMLAKTSCRPNTLVQHAGEFVVTFPRGYHAGFNLGFNCAESVNFALDSWIELGRKAQACNCVNFSVRINVDELLREREFAMAKAAKPNSKSISSHSTSSSPRKRKSDENDTPGSSKKAKFSVEVPQRKVTIRLKLGPRPPELDPFPCCLCVSPSRDGLFPVHDKPLVQHLAYADTKIWMAHESCARVLPETWLDEVETGPVLEDGTRKREKMVFGVDAIVKDRWNLKCTACSKNRPKMHGAPIQCTRGKCSKSFHVSCARDGAENGIVYCELGEVEKEVVLVDMAPVPNLCAPMEIDGATTPSQDPTPDVVDVITPNSEALKVVKKIEFQLLCPQHNPQMLEAKKAYKQDKIRNDLLALAPMSRIKIRVSAGIFEVSLVRVIEESNSVEVLWDRGIKREFKWGSVVFGNLEGQTIGQKPTEAAPELEHQDGSPFMLPQPPPATAESQIPYQPRLGTYPYPLGAWTYHYGPFPSAAVSASSLASGVTQAQGDSVATTASTVTPGTFPYPYTAVQYSPMQSSAFGPPIKYPYGAPALPAAPSTVTSTSTSAVSSPLTRAASSTPTPTPLGAQVEEQRQPYNDIQWKKPYTGPRPKSRSPTLAAESQSQVQNGSTTPSGEADANESTLAQKPTDGGVVGVAPIAATNSDTDNTAKSESSIDDSNPNHIPASSSSVGITA